LILLGIRASEQATTRLSPAEVLFGRKLRLPVVCEAILENLPEETDTEERDTAGSKVQAARMAHLRKVEAVALRNIEISQGKLRASSARAAAKRKEPDLPGNGDLILIRDFTSSGQHWETNVYKCAGYTASGADVIVEGEDGNLWTENIKNVKRFNTATGMPTRLEDELPKAVDSSA